MEPVERARTDQPNRSRVEADWAARGYRGGLWIDPPGQVWSDYAHDMDELFMVVDGGIELTVNGLILRPPAGQEVLIPAGVRHTVRNVGASSALWMYAYKYRS